MVEEKRITPLWEELIFRHWPRKLVAIISAVIIWFLVNQSLTITRTIPNVPIRIVDLPKDKTVDGLLPHGVLSERVDLTLKGKRTLMEEIRPGDLEVVISAEGKKEGWIASINKRSLVSISPDIDIYENISEVRAPDLYIKLTNLVTAEIPIIITKPIGDPPKGYQFVDVWPKELVQTISGPEERIEALKSEGLEIIFNLNKISSADLDALKSRSSKEDEVSYFAPQEWKQITIPLLDATVALNDPRADFLRLDFLRQELIPLEVELPITLFFPVNYSKTLNPDTYSLATGALVEKKNGLKIFTPPLYAKDVSRTFLDVVRNYLQITIIAAPKTQKDILDWTLEFIDLESLENKYILKSIEEKDRENASHDLYPKMREEYLRNKFRSYVRKLVLYLDEGKELCLKPELQTHTVTLELSSLE